MAFGRQQGGSIYLDRSPLQPESSRAPKLRFLRELSPAKLFLQFTVVLLGLVVLASGLQLTLLAESIRSVSAADRPDVGDTGGEDDGATKGNATLEKAMKNAGFDPKSEADMEEWSKKVRKPQNRDSFDSVFYRLFVPQYINQTPDAYSTTDSGRKAGCDNPKTGNGTVVYHNCDVPNISAEIAQDIVRFIIPSGAYGAAQESAKAISPSFGLPNGLLPGNGTVPVSEGSRTNKYTALELFGYNLNYTAYLGEWDYIKVFTEARAMSNFGVFDNLKLGGKAIIDGAVNAAQNATDSWTDGWNSAGLAGAIGGFFSGAFEGFTSGAVGTVLDTSDLNVFEQQAWYRPDFGATTYGARSMNSAELSAESLRWMNSMMNEFSPNQATMPGDFPFEKNLPPKPLEAISSCDVISNSSGATVAWGQRSTPPGVTEAQCKTEGDRIKANLQAAANEAAEDGETAPTITAPSHIFDAEGVQAQESIDSWSSTHAGFIAGMNKYGWSCGLPADGTAAARAAGIDEWYGCFNASYATNYEKTLDAEKVKENNKYTDSIFGRFAGIFAGWFAAQNQQDNFNAAYNRFVCQDPTTGRDIMDGGRSARVYNLDGSLTGNCAAIRAPIQDGLFGSGYTAGQDSSAPDTRRTAFSPMESLATALGNTAAGMSLQVSIFVTQLSNTILGLAFTPVLDALGIRDVIVSLIESFRDSMFMPLAVLMAALGAITILWRAVRSNAYSEAFTSFLYIVAAFLLGTILLAKPAATLKVVDEGPVLIENTILTAMFGPNGSQDKLCTATGTASGTGAGGKQIDGSSGFNPNASVRMLMCENWRSFAFTPWVFGQWGTGFENLYANGYAPTGGKALSNTNQALVGNAGVNFGGGQVVHNWATYQLAVTSVGTSTTADPSRPTGVVNKNFYRIVDAQMGPNGGAGTDPTYAQSWSKFTGDTAAAMFLGPIASIMGAVVVIGYTIAKLELVLVSIFLLVILPIMLLIGIHPTFGRQKLKAYGGTLLGLMIQRILLTVLIGMLFKFMFSISASGASYLIIAIVSIVLAAIFIGYRRELLGLVQKAMDEAAGSFAGGKLYDARTQLAQHMPTSLRNFASMRQQEAKGMAFGAVAAIRHGQLPTEIPGTLKKIRDTYTQRESAAQMVSGLGGGQKAQRIRKEIEGDLRSEFNHNDKYAGAREALLGASGVEGGRFDKDGNLVAPVYETDENGNSIAVGEEIQRTGFGRKKSLNRRAVRRSMAKHRDLSAKLQRLEEKKTRRIAKGEQRALKKMGYGDINSLEGEQRVQAQAARARIHLELTRHSRDDGRSLDSSGRPIVDRPGSRIEQDISATSQAIQGAVDSGVASGRFMPNDARRQAQIAAYGELQGLVVQAAKDADAALGVSTGVKAAADSIDRTFGVTDTVDDLKRATKKLLGRNDNSDFTGR